VTKYAKVYHARPSGKLNSVGYVNQYACTSSLSFLHPFSTTIY